MQYPPTHRQEPAFHIFANWLGPFQLRLSFVSVNVSTSAHITLFHEFLEPLVSTEQDVADAELSFEALAETLVLFELYDGMDVFVTCEEGELKACKQGKERCCVKRC
jgi:hypothetical protein